MPTQVPSASPAAARRRGLEVVIVAADSRLRPDLLDDALCDVIRADAGSLGSVRVLVPMVLHPTLPISACPPRIAVRLERLRQTAAGVIERMGVTGGAELAPCRSVPALVHAVQHPDRLVLVGRAGWAVRRAARGAADDVVVVAAPAGRDAERRRHVPRLRPAG